jgi:hypothetical protein
MKILKSYAAGFDQAQASKKIITIIYGITLLLASTVALTLYNLLTSTFGSRMELYKLLPDFNYSIYSDFMNNYREVIRFFKPIALWFGLLYFFFTIFFAGGILKTFEASLVKSKAQTFFAGCSKFFFRFLRLGVYALMLQVLFAILIATPFSIILNSAMETKTEPEIFVIILAWALIQILVFVLITIASDYAKIILVKEDSKKVWCSLAGGFKFTFRKTHKTFTLYLLLLVFPIILTALYFLIEDFIGMRSSFTILVMFVIQQIVVWLRIFSKVWILGGEYELFNSAFVEVNKPLITQEIITNESL